MRQYGRVVGIGLESEAIARRRLSRRAGVEAGDGLHGHGAKRLSDPRKDIPRRRTRRLSVK